MVHVEPVANTWRTYGRWLPATLLAVLLLTGTGAGRPPARAGETGGILRVNYPDVQTLDPQRAIDDADLSLAALLFRGLFWTDSDGTPIPAAAAAVPTRANGGVSEDGRTVTIHLKPGLHWSDGAPLEAGDFAYSLRRALNPRLAAPLAHWLFAIEGAEAHATAAPDDNDAVAGIEVRDAGTLILRLREPHAALPVILSLPAFAPLRRDVVEAGGAAEDNGLWPAAGMPGSGPFLLRSFRPHNSAVLERNPAYGLGAAPRLAGLTFTIAADGEAGVQAFLAGTTDIAPLPAFRLAPAAATPDLSAVSLSAPPPVTRGLRVNLRRPPLSDRRVRVALATAIDRDAYAREGRTGLATPSACWLPPGTPGHNPADCTAQHFDPPTARAWLAAAPGDATVPPLSLVAPADAAGRQAAEFLQMQLGATLGIEIRPRYLSGAARAAVLTGGDWDLDLFGWQEDFHDGEAWLYGLFTTGGRANAGGYGNPEFDDLVAAARASEDQDARLALLRAAHRLLLADAAVIPLERPVRTYLVAPGVRGLRGDPRDGALPGQHHIEAITLTSP